MKSEPGEREKRERKILATMKSEPGETGARDWGGRKGLPSQSRPARFAASFHPRRAWNRLVNLQCMFFERERGSTSGRSLPVRKAYEYPPPLPSGNISSAQLSFRLQRRQGRERGSGYLGRRSICGPVPFNACKLYALLDCTQSLSFPFVIERLERAAKRRGMGRLPRSLQSRARSRISLAPVSQLQSNALRTITTSTALLPQFYQSGESSCQNKAGYEAHKF